MVSEIIRCGAETIYNGLVWTVEKGSNAFEYGGNKAKCLANEFSDNLLEMSTDAKYNLGTLAGASGIALYNVRKADHSFFLTGAIAGCAIAYQIYCNPANYNRRNNLDNYAILGRVVPIVIAATSARFALENLTKNSQVHGKKNGWNNVAAYLSSAVIVSEAIKLASKSNC